MLYVGMGWMGWDWMVIIGRRSSKSTFGAKNCTKKVHLKGSGAREHYRFMSWDADKPLWLRRGPNHLLDVSIRIVFGEVDRLLFN